MMEKSYDFSIHGDTYGSLHIGGIELLKSKSRKYWDYIVHILTVEENTPTNIVGEYSKEYIHILDVVDNSNECILDHLEKTIKFIDAGINKKKRFLILFTNSHLISKVISD